MKYVLCFLAGAIVIFIVLKILVKKPDTGTPDKTFDNILALAKTKEAGNLIASDEFKALMKTSEFKTFAVDFGTEQLVNFITI
jgi:hypothetical protein